MAKPYELTTRELLSIVFKEKWRLAAIFFGFLIAAIAISFLMTPFYEATTRLLVKSGREFQVRSDPGQTVASVPYATKQEIVNSEIQILTSRDLIAEVIHNIGIAKLYPRIAAASPADPSAMDAAIRQFSASFKASPVEQADVIDVTYRNPSRDVAIQALAMVVDLYQRKHAQMFSDSGYRFVEQQTKDYQTQLDAVTRRITDLRNSQSLFDVEAQRGKLIDDRSSLASILEQLRSQSVDAHQRAGFLTARLKATPQLIPGGSSTAEAVEQAKDRLLDLQVRQQQLRDRYVGEVKPIEDIRQEIGVLNAFVAKNEPGNRRQVTQRNPAYDDLTVSLNRALADAAPLDDQIALRQRQADDIDARLRALSEGARNLQELERERNVLDELVHTYRTRYEEARMNADEKTVSVSVIQQADSPTRPAGPNHLLFAIAGIIIGSIGAAVLMLYFLVFRETLITVESVERILGVPVLTSVPAK